MAALFSAVCSCCGQRYEGSPNFACSMPDYFHALSPEDRQAYGKIDHNICMINRDGRKDFFIRVCLEITIHGVTDPFVYGVWTSISDKNLKRYLDTWEDTDESDVYSGWLSNQLTLYPSTLGMKVIAHPRRNSQRPWLEIMPCDHPLYDDWKNGLTFERAQEMALKLHHAS